MTIGKTVALTRWSFVGQVMSLLFNMLSSLVITFLPRSKSFSISWLQSPSAVTLEPPKIKPLTVSSFPIYLPWSDGTRCPMIFIFWMLSFKPTFSLSSFTFIKQLFSSSSLSAIRVVHLHIWGYWYFSRQYWFQLVTVLLLPLFCLELVFQFHFCSFPYYLLGEVFLASLLPCFLHCLFVDYPPTTPCLITQRPF